MEILNRRGLGIRYCNFMGPLQLLEKVKCCYDVLEQSRVHVRKKILKIGFCLFIIFHEISFSLSFFPASIWRKWCCQSHRWSKVQCRRRRRVSCLFFLRHQYRFSNGDCNQHVCCQKSVLVWWSCECQQSECPIETPIVCHWWVRESQKNMGSRDWGSIFKNPKTG